jgi:hypothetical protein
MREYHHIGIPTQTQRKNETYLEEYRVYVSGRFEPDSPLPELVQTVPHVAFRVDDLEAELKGKEVLIEPNSPSEGVRVAFIVNNGAPIEFIEIKK